MTTHNCGRHVLRRVGCAKIYITAKTFNFRNNNVPHPLMLKESVPRIPLIFVTSISCYKN